MSENSESYKLALVGKKIPILVLDQKWHRLFAIHGKPQTVLDLETELNALLARQGKLNTEIKQLKHLKSQLMDNIVQNMDGTNAAAENTTKERRLEEDRKKLDEANAKIDADEDELLELPNRIREVNEALMLESMEYFYEKLRINQQEAQEIDAWIQQVRIDLKKNIIRKQNREINNREMYAYLHDILGPEVLDMFDMQLDEQKKPQES